jgi:hypothetical protein
LGLDALKGSDGEGGLGHAGPEASQDKSGAVQLSVGVGKQILECIKCKETLTM